MNKNPNNEKVLKILIAIGIIAILISVYMQYLKPFAAELRKQKSDQTKIQELSSINSALNKIKETDLNLFLGEPNKIYISLPSPNSNCDGLELPPLSNNWEYRCKPEVEFRKANGNGWIPVDFTKLNDDSFKELPIDMINDTKGLNYYTFVKNEQSEWILTAILESKKYQKKKALIDNGIDPTRFEIGSNIQLWAEATGLAGYWSFNEGEGKIIKDLSGNNNDGALVNSPTWVDGKIGKALSFDGVRESVTVSSIYYNFYLITINGGKLQAYITEAVFSTESLVLDVWSYVGFVNDPSAGTLKLYINGVENGNFASQGADTLSVFTWVKSHDLTGSRAIINRHDGFIDRLDIGVRNAYLHWFDGLIDEVRIYNRALSTQEVQIIYNTTK